MTREDFDREYRAEAISEARKLVAAGKWEDDKHFPNGLPRPKELTFLFSVTDLVSCLAQHHQVPYWEYRSQLIRSMLKRILPPELFEKWNELQS